MMKDENCVDVRCLFGKEARFTNYILYAIFCVMGTLDRKTTTWSYSARTITELAF